VDINSAVHGLAHGRLRDSLLKERFVMKASCRVATKSLGRGALTSPHRRALPHGDGADAKRAFVGDRNAFSSAIAVQQNDIEESSSLSEQMAHRR
jgi:hypothetical protein